MTVQPGSIRVLAPAKVNLILKVLGRLPNGYHELWSLMQTVDLFDRLSLRINPSSQNIRLSCQLNTVPTGEGNLVYQAAEKVLKKAGIDVGVDIELEKVIPMGAGLGGGSSDAAATIYGLVQLLGLSWSLGKMAELGGELGSDIPFFFYGPQAVISGWGETVTPVHITGSRWVVLVNPGFPIETGWAYRQLAEVRQHVLSLPDNLQDVTHHENLGWPYLMSLIENDFEPALFPTFPRLRELKAQLLDAGAEAALLSGSGSTMFGVFSQEDLAQDAAHLCAKDLQFQVFCVPTRTIGLELSDN